MFRIFCNRENVMAEGFFNHINQAKSTYISIYTLQLCRLLLLPYILKRVKASRELTNCNGLSSQFHAVLLNVR